MINGSKRIKYNDFFGGIFTKNKPQIRCTNCNKILDSKCLYNADIKMYLNIKTRLCDNCIDLTKNNIISKSEIRNNLNKLGFFGIYTETSDSDFTQINIQKILLKINSNNPKQKNSIIFYGPTRSGKTYASAHIAKKLLQSDVPIDAIGRIRILDTIKAVSEIFNANTTRRQYYEDKYGTINYLIMELHEVPENKRPLTDYQRLLLYNIIDKRLQLKLPTIFITNIPSRDLSIVISNTIVKIIMEMADVVKFNGSK